MNNYRFLSATSNSYQKIARPILFTFNPEKVHNFFINTGRIYGDLPGIRALLGGILAQKHLSNQVKIFGRTISSPVMLSAGFDKNADLVKILPSLGFGGAEIGTVTLRPYEGNREVRLTRVPQVKGILVNFGLYSHGAEKVLKRFRDRVQKPDFLWGLSIAPTNDKQSSSNINKLVEEYLELFPLASACTPDYITLNISCPNTKNGQPFLQSDNLYLLLSALDKIKPKVPVAIKLLPDLTEQEFERILAVAKPFSWLKGIICGNLTKQFDRKLLPVSAKKRPGGLSGPNLFTPMIERIKLGKAKTGDRFTWIACGGISSAKDVEQALEVGATAVQMITAMIYQGPSAIAKINYELAKK
jgi:dihydroorotate dehydrogenase